MFQVGRYSLNSQIERAYGFAKNFLFDAFWESDTTKFILGIITIIKMRKYYLNVTSKALKLTICSGVQFLKQAYLPIKLKDIEDILTEKDTTHLNTSIIKFIEC